MKVNGSHDVAAPRERVWAALIDPAVLARTLPGCLSLERTGEDEYRVTLEAGVASIRGVYAGRVALADHAPPGAYTLRAQGQGGPGTVDATAAVTLTETPEGGTRITYDADAVVGGTIGGVGQRVLAGVAKRTAAQFFSAIEADLAAGGAAPAAAEDAAPAAADGTGSAGAGSAGAAAAGPAAGGALGHVFAGRAAGMGGGPADGPGFVVGTLVGAAIALLGVLVGRRAAR